MNDKIKAAIQRQGWTIRQYDDGTADICRFSDAGEDFFFSIRTDDDRCILRELYDYYEDFDVDEHVEMWLSAKQSGVSGVPSARELVHDAEDIEKQLERLWLAVQRALDRNADSRHKIAR